MRGGVIANAVRGNSLSRCNCGSNRVILPVGGDFRSLKHIQLCEQILWEGILSADVIVRATVGGGNFQ